ncbi:hypothetical protein lbkm_2658 [Lachnospiraceae bacterium KM106-2]|nr:hypothetical protein lbkm_2658 [Lachnospiraceae bacterium KM106-2]
MLEFFPSKVANILGISILALMGVEFIRKGLFGSEEATYDFDKSKEIELWEAFVLGFALSADSISAGIGAATIGLNSMLIPITVGCMQVFFLSIGEVLIGHCSLVNKMSQKVCGLISGFMLLLIAIIRIISI